MSISPNWEQVHAARDWGAYPQEEMVRWVSRNYGMTPRKHRHEIKFLDLGCGQGASTWYLAREGYHVTALDGSKSALTKLHRRLADEGLHTDISLGDMADVKYPDRYFDAIVDVVSICHNLNYQDIYNETARLIKRGGRLFSMVPKNGCNPKPFEQYGDFEFFSLEQLRRALNGKFDPKVGSLEVQYPGDPTTSTMKFWLVDGLRIT